MIGEFGLFEDILELLAAADHFVRPVDYRYSLGYNCHVGDRLSCTVLEDVWYTQETVSEVFGVGGEL